VNELKEEKVGARLPRPLGFGIFYSNLVKICGY